MKTSELIALLKRNHELYGDLPIIGGYMSDDTPLKTVFVLDKNGCDIEIEGENGGTPVGLFFE